MSRAEPSAPRGESPWSCSEPRQVKARPSSIGAVSSLSRTVLPSGGGRGQMSEREIPSKVPRHVDWPEEPSHERGSKADQRDRVATERDVAADERDRVANARDARTDRRDAEVAGRGVRVDGLLRRALVHDKQAEERDRDAEARDELVSCALSSLGKW